MGSNPSLVRLLKEGEVVEDLLILSPEAILIRWVNYQLQMTGKDKNRTSFFGEGERDRVSLDKV